MESQVVFKLKLKLIESGPRAVGQPAFVNNPICGAVIFASLFVNEWQVGIGCLLGGSIATVAELVLN